MSLESSDVDLKNTSQIVHHNFNLKTTAERVFIPAKTSQIDQIVETLNNFSNQLTKIFSHADDFVVL